MRIINLGILAHVDAGKTTVTEGLLVHSGVKRQMGRVDTGTTTTDSMAIERERGLTVRASTVSFTWENTKVNLIDTPGHMDFIAEVERSLSVLDGVILVISAKEGVQPQTRVIFQKLRSMGIPTILFINKIDRMGASAEITLADVRAKLTENTIVMQTAEGVGTRGASVRPLSLETGMLHEAIVETSADLIERYLSGVPVSGEECRARLTELVRACGLHPVYFGSALHDVGVEPLLCAVTELFVSRGDSHAPLSAAVYKVEWDEAGRKRLYLRLFAGTLRVRERMPVDGKEEGVQINGMLAVRDGKFVPTDCLVAGDIGVLLDTPGLACGSFLGVRPPQKKGREPAPPLLSVSLLPRVPAERPALLSAMQRLTEEDPFLRLRIKPETGEITVRLYGALQREVLEALLLERFGLAAVFSPLQTLYKEKPLRSAAAQIPMGHGNLHAAGISLTIEPLPPGTGIVYETKVSFGALTKSFQNGVQEGVLVGLAEGLGMEIVDTKVVFTDMEFSSVTSTPADFRRLAVLVVRKALEAAGLRRLEPWLSFVAIMPLENQRKALSALQKLRAVIEDVTFGEAECTVQGEAPLDTVKDFAAELLSMTQGKGVFTTSFLDYREVE